MHRSLAAILALLACALPTRAEDDALRMHVLDCGTMLGMDAAPFLPELEEHPEAFDFTNRCFLVVHPKGTLLWDAGLPHGFGAGFIYFMMWATSFGDTDVDPGLRMVAQLEELDMQPSDVDYIAFSHVHFDHVGQAEDFTGATWLVQKVERDWVFDPELDNEAVFPDLVEPMREAKHIELEGDHDVFGDGSVEILSSPGHTPGHQSLFVDLPQTGPVVLSGDLYHTEENREHQMPPDFNTDRDQTRGSMQRIEAIVRQRGAVLWIQHSGDSGTQAPALVR